MDEPSVSVIGCGWLGLPLAKELIREGYHVKGSTTTLEKVPVLQKAGIFCFLATLEKVAKNSQQPMADDESYFINCNNIQELFNSEIVVITLPFRRDFVDPRDYHKQIQTILTQCSRSATVRFVIFTSSTSIYPDGLERAAEDVSFTPDSNRSQTLMDIEKEVLLQSSFSAAVVRFAGLYGGIRKIGQFLAGQRELTGGDRPVNFIHEQDAVGILKKVIEHRASVAGQIFNGCSDGHPTRRELYTTAAKKMNLAPPEFIKEDFTAKKIVLNEKVKRIFGYKFLHPDPLLDVISG